MKNLLLIMLLIVAIVGCQPNSVESGNNNEIDSIGGLKNGQTKEQRISEWKDSMLTAMKNEQLSKDTATTENCPVKVLSARPVEKEYSSYKDISLTYKNGSGKNIAAIKFKWYGINAFGDPADMGSLSDGLGGGFSDTRLKAGRTDTNEWSILSKDLKKVVKAWAYEVAFEDGTKWKASNE